METPHPEEKEAVYSQIPITYDKGNFLLYKAKNNGFVFYSSSSPLTFINEKQTSGFVSKFPWQLHGNTKHRYTPSFIPMFTWLQK